MNRLFDFDNSNGSLCSLVKVDLQNINNLIFTIIDMASYIHKTYKKVVEFDNPDNTLGHLQKKEKIPT